MRAKFVKAELLYSSAAQQQPPNPSQIQSSLPPPTMGAVDYSAFSQPPEMPDAIVMNNINHEQKVEIENKESSDFESDFKIPAFQPENFGEGEDESMNPFFKSFNFQTTEPIADPTNNILTSTTAKEAFPQTSSKAEVSKFGFNGVFPENDLNEGLESESLSDNIAELELTSNTKELNQKFSQAKYQIEMGNTEKGNKILGEMMAKKEIRYKEFSSIDENIMKTFEPISD